MLCAGLGRDCGQHPEDDGVAAILEEELAVRERLRVDPNSLDEDLGRCASDIAYVGARQARAVLEHGRARIGVKKLRALAYLRCKEAAIDTYGPRGATVDVVNSLVEGDPQVLAAEERELTGEVRLALAKTNVAASMARRDMLVQVGAARRAEMERDPVVRRRGPE